MTPMSLEWLTVNRYGGRIVDAGVTVFSGYLDSEEAVQAAEWLRTYQTPWDDYGSNDGYYPMTKALVNGDLALAVSHAFLLSAPANNFMEAVELNPDIGIAPLPGGMDLVNPAQMTGLSIMSNSGNKEAAMEFLRYLMKDGEDAYEDILLHSLQSTVHKTIIEGLNSDISSVVLYEMKRSFPAALYMNMAPLNHGINNDHKYLMLRAIMEGAPASVTLERNAQYVDMKFEEFRKDPEAYGRCIRNNEELCR